MVLVFGSHQEAFDGIASLEVCLDPMFLPHILHALTQSFNIRKHHIWPLVACCNIGNSVLWSSLFLGYGGFVLELHPVQGPHWVFVFCEDLLEMFFLIFQQLFVRAIKEAIYIRVNNPSLNRNIGKYHLPHIWDEVLMNNSELKLKYPPSGNNICHMAITSANHNIVHPVAIASATWQ